MADSLSVTVDGMEALEKRFIALDKEARQRVNRAVNVSAIEFHRDVVKTIRKPTGRYRQYKRGKTAISKGKKRIHYSSMPGSPPNSDSGNLVKNTRITRRPTLRRSWAHVVSGAKYASWLEDGTRKMKARPFWGPMLRKKRPIFVSRIRQAINSAI
jgi:HK97 gp10 family phage protein